MMWTWELERLLHALLQAAPGLGVVLLAAVIGVGVLRLRPLAGAALLFGLALYAGLEVVMPFVAFSPTDDLVLALQAILMVLVVHVMQRDEDAWAVRTGAPPAAGMDGGPVPCWPGVGPGHPPGS